MDTMVQVWDEVWGDYSVVVITADGEILEEMIFLRQLDAEEAGSFLAKQYRCPCEKIYH